MILSSNQLKKLKLEFDTGEQMKKTNTITFQEAYKLCKRYINGRDEDSGVSTSYADKRRETLGMIDDFVNTLKDGVDGFLDDLDDLKRALKDEIVNFGILTSIIDPANEAVDELQINSLTEIFYTEHGVLRKLDNKFNNNGEVKKIIEKLIEKGERLNSETPFINARTGDGFRLNVTHPSISKNMTYGLTLRKQKVKPISEKDILKNLTVTKNMLDLMKLFPRGRVNWSTVGGTGSGKTVLNNVLLPFIDPGLRCIFIENPTELRPEQYDEHGNVINNFLQLEAKNFDGESVTAPTMYNLLTNALRQTPDYIVPGEVRGPKEFEVALAAAQTGHNVFTTYHAENPEDAVFRFLNAALKESKGAPADLIMRDICAAFRFIINVKRLPDGTRRVMYISEVYPTNDIKNVNIVHLYKYQIDRVEEVLDPKSGKMRPKIHGRHIRLNAISTWFRDKLLEEGIPLERFEFFTTEPSKLKDEEDNLILNDSGREIVLEEEPEYKNTSPEYDIEKLKTLHRERLRKIQNGDNERKI
jgi:pilus assembly protein CpaF